MSTATCPFCDVTYSESDTTFQEYKLPPSEYDFLFGISPREYIRVLVNRCPECRRFMFRAVKETGERDHFDMQFYPQAVAKPLPDYIPEAIRNDYREAQMVARLSPKAAATLCRRCLQGMIRDFWGITKPRLKDEIDALEQIVPPLQWKAIDGLREIGNISAHMERDVNTIIEVEPEEAEMLLKLIDSLIENWYIARHREETLYNSIASCADAKRKQKHEAE